jgi:hypothetical protein
MKLINKLTLGLALATALAYGYDAFGAKFRQGNLVERIQSTASAAGTLTLVAGDEKYQRITGSTTHTVVLPDATTLVDGLTFAVVNDSTGGDVTVQYDDTTTLATVADGTTAFIFLSSNATSNGVWEVTHPQPFSEALTAIAAVSSNGAITRTAANTYSARTMTGTANEVVIADGDGVSGNPTFGIADDAVLPGNGDVTLPSGTTAQRPACSGGEIRYNTDTPVFEICWGSWTDLSVDGLTGISSNGLVARIGVDSYTNRTVTGTTDEIDVSNGDGASGNPTIGVADDIVLPGTGAATLPAGTTAQQPGAPTAGMIRYNSDDGSFEGYTSSWGAIGGGGGGFQVNYIEDNWNAETNTTGWSQYDDGDVATPVDGTGGAANNITFVRETTTQIRGDGSFETTATSVNDSRGEGVSYDFTVAAADLPAVLEISFDHEMTGGNSADIEVFIYDKDAGSLIPVVSKSLSSTDARFVGTFQTHPTNDDYRLILHYASSTVAAGAIFTFDNVIVTPSVAEGGAVVTEWESFTPTGSWTTNTTYTGFKRRVGDSAEIQYKIALSGAPTSANLTINMPSGMSVDTGKLAANGTGSMHAMAWAIESGVEEYLAQAALSSDVFAIRGLETDGAAGNDVEEASAYSQAYPFTWGSGDSFTLNVAVPITGWEATATSSAPLDVAFQATSDTSAAMPTATGTDRVYEDEVFDTHNAYDPSTGAFTVPVSGKYSFTASVQSATGTYAAGNVVVIEFDVDGVNMLTGTERLESTTSSAYQATVTGILDLTEGEVVTVEAYKTGTAVNESGVTVTNYFEGHRITVPDVEVVVVESGGAGGINYIGNPGAETDTSDWAQYDDGAVADPVDGTGGSASNIALTRNTTTPLRDSGDFLLTHTSANSSQGEGMSYDFTLDPADQGAVMDISFDYYADTGDATEMGVYIYDRDGTALIDVSPNILEDDSDGIGTTKTFRGTFRTHATNDDYRLIIHHSATTVSAGEESYFDNFVVAPAKLIDKPGFEVRFDPSRSAWLYEEFLGVSGTTEGYSTSVSGTGATAALANQTTIQTGENNGRPGVIKQTTGTTATGRVNWYTNHLMLNAGNGDLNDLVYMGGHKIPTLSTVTEEFIVSFGFSTQQSTFATRKSGAWFEYDRLNNTNWRCTTDDNGTNTPGDTGVAVDTNWHDFRIEWDNDLAAVRFYIDRELVCTQTTDITSNRQFNMNFGMYKSAGTTAREFYTDYQYWEIFWREGQRPQ